VLAAIASSALGGVAGGTTRFAIGSSDPVTLGVFAAADRVGAADQMAAAFARLP
jgi:hypothetical protein